MPTEPSVADDRRSQRDPGGVGRCLIIGAGPAGLTAAYELSKLNIPAVIFEADPIVGGIARTASHNGYRFDIGGHRFFTKVPSVQAMWQEVLGEEFLKRPRLSRIFYGNRFFDYPLKPANALFGLGLVESMRIGFSYLKARMFPSPQEQNFEQWVTNRFGRRLYELFFKTYTEKVWGMPCSEIGAEWAAQRIKNLDLLTAVKNALLGSSKKDGAVVTTLIDSFQYPRFGPGQMWERCQGLLEERGYPTVMGRRVVRVRRQGSQVISLVLRDRAGNETEEYGTQFLSSMPIRELLHAFDPPPPANVIAAADRLRYRDFLTVVLIVDRANVFPDNWIYIHSPEVKVGRIQNFGNWSPEMVPDPTKSSLGLEYFVQENDELWSATDANLIDLGRRECARIGLIKEHEVVDATVVRMPKAYPVYDHGYREALETIRSFLDPITNLQLMGRNGLHRYNNQDHSMLTAMYAARNIAGEHHDVWNVNVDQEYHEEVKEARPASGDRLVPARVQEDEVAALVRSAFARYDPVALGTAIGAVLGVALFLGTVVLLFGPEPIGPTLSLLGQYFLGYSASWAGAFVGLVEAGGGGFGFGYVLALALNAVIAWHENRLYRRIELGEAMAALDQEPE